MDQLLSTYTTRVTLRNSVMKNEWDSVATAMCFLSVQKKFPAWLFFVYLTQARVIRKMGPLLEKCLSIRLAYRQVCLFWFLFVLIGDL